MSVVIGLLGAAGGAGALAAYLVDRRTSLSARNWFLVLGAAVAALFLAVAASLPPALIVAALIAAIAAASACYFGHRWRWESLRAVGELREHEKERVMIWERAKLEGRPRRRIESQGELVTERSWPEGMPYVPMSADGGGRVPRGEGRHVLVLGGTGSGKTVSAGRITAGRVLADEVPALVLDPKGDADLYEQLRELAAYRGVPFVVFDPFAGSESDRWDPLWSTEPGRTVARILSPIQTSEPYYADTLRIHLGVVAEALAVLGLWPASMPLLLEAAQAEHFAVIRDLVNAQGAPPEIARRIEEQAARVFSKAGERDIASGAARLRVVAGTSWREVLTPREDGRAVQLPQALRAGAIVLWRTWVEDTPEEAEAITTLALADAIAAAAELRGETEWIVVLDEFGSVLAGNAARRALGILGRARSAGGQAIVVTQSAADVPTATENASMLESLSDNFSGFVVHRQTSSESREWVAKLCGTRELWQSTDRTTGGGRFAEGTGSRRRAREFIVRPDELKELQVGESFVWAPGGPSPALVDVAIPPRLAERVAASNDAAYADAGPKALAEYQPPASPLRAAPPAKREPEPIDEPIDELSAEYEPAETSTPSPSRKPADERL